MKTDELKSCPFCGGQALYVFSVNAETHRIGCMKKGCYCNIDKQLQCYSSKSVAVDKWNERDNNEN